MAIWAELLPDLEDLDAYGGGPYGVEDHVWELLEEITKRLASKKVYETYRREILDCVLPFIKSRNSGVGDALDEVAFAACYNDSELRYLAESLEEMHNDWQTRKARNIYRQIGDYDKYLELRLKHMELGADFHDLATFYWDSGEKEKSLQTARHGLKNAKGRMDDLRAFVADRAKESGDREAWIELKFDQATDYLTLDKYQKFKAMCKAEEWELFEPRILKKLNGAGKTEKMKIHMDRKDHEKVINILVKCHYPQYNGESQDVRIAEKLAVKVKNDNLRRPAFQQEFARTVPGWEALK